MAFTGARLSARRLGLIEAVGAAAVPNRTLRWIFLGGLEGSLRRKVSAGAD